MNIRHISLAALLTIGLGATASTPIIEVSEISAEVFDAARRADSNTMRADTVTDSRISAHLRTLALEEFMKLDESTRSHEYDYTPGDAPLDNAIILHYPSAEMYCILLPNLHGMQAWCFDDNTYHYLGNIPSPVAVSREGLIMSQVYQDCDTPLDLYFYRRIGDTLLLRSNFMSPYYGVPFEVATTSDGSLCIGPTEIFSDYQCLRIKINDAPAYYSDTDYPDYAKAVAGTIFTALREHFSLDSSGMVFVRTADRRLGRPYMVMFQPRDVVDFQYYCIKEDKLEVFIKASFSDARRWMRSTADTICSTDSLINEGPYTGYPYMMLRYDGKELTPVFFGKYLPDCLPAAPSDNADVEKFKSEQSKCLICYSECMERCRKALSTAGNTEMKQEKLLAELQSRGPGEICTLIASPYHRYEIMPDSIVPTQSLTYHSPDIYIYAETPLDNATAELYREAHGQFGRWHHDGTDSGKCRAFSALRTADGKLICEAASSVVGAFNIEPGTTSIPTLLLLDYLLRQRIIRCI